MKVYKKWQKKRFQHVREEKKEEKIEMVYGTDSKGMYMQGWRGAWCDR